MSLPSIVLTPFAGANNLPKYILDQGSWRGVVPANTAMDVIQQPLTLFNRDTVLQYPGVAGLVELFLDDDK